MSEVRIGSWIVDLDAGVAKEGDLVVEVITDDERSFAARYSRELPLEIRHSVMQEVFEVMQRARALRAWQRRE